MSKFDEIAQRFGHSTEHLNKGDVIATTRQVNSIGELRDLVLSGSSPEERAKRAADFETAHPDLIDEKNKSIEAISLRADAHLNGDRPLNDHDKAAIGGMFPTTVQLVSAKNRTVNTHVVLGDMAPPVLLNYDTLTFEPGGSMSAIATSVTLTVTNLVNNAGTAGDDGVNYTFGIFGKRGVTGDTGVSQPKAATGVPNPGKSSGTPSPGICTGAPDAQAGGPGANGVTGGEGDPGQTGIPNITANFAFTNITGAPIYIQTQSGEGGPGGPGGKGGDGGDGGKGGNGCSSGCESTTGAQGGNAGNGLDGGKGGDGGSAVNGRSINVTIGAGVDMSMVQHGGLQAQPGQGGAGGLPGIAGTPGKGGSGGKHSSPGGTGDHGTNGQQGKRGDPGKFQGSPGTITVKHAT